MAYINCKNCGCQMSDKSEACPMCGMPIDADVEEFRKQIEEEQKERKQEENRSRDEVSRADVLPEKDNTALAQQGMTKNKSMLPIIIGVVSLLAIAMVTLVVIKVFHKGKTKTDKIGSDVMVEKEVIDEVEDDFYDASPFINGFFKHCSESRFDGFTNHSSLDDILKHKVYSDIAESDDYYPNNVDCEVNQHITEDIILSKVSFNFPTAIYTNNEYGEKDYLLDEKFQCITYGFDLLRNARVHNQDISYNVKEKIAELYHISFDNYNSKCDDGSFYFGSGNIFSFIVTTSSKDMGIYVFTSKSDYYSFLEECKGLLDNDFTIENY